MLSLKKKSTAILGILLGLFIVIVFCSALYLEQRSVQVLIKDKINEKIPGEISWKNLRFSIFSGIVDLDGLSIQGSDKNEIIFLKRVAINLDWLGLLKKEISFSSVLLESPRADIRTDSNGWPNLVNALQDKEKASGAAPKNSGPFQKTICRP